MAAATPVEAATHFHQGLGEARVVGRVKDEIGASAAEYALLVAGVAAVIVAVVVLLGGEVSGLFSDTCTKVASAVSGGSC